VIVVRGRSADLLHDPTHLWIPTSPLPQPTQTVRPGSRAKYVRLVFLREALQATDCFRERWTHRRFVTSLPKDSQRKLFLLISVLT